MKKRTGILAIILAAVLMLAAGCGSAGADSAAGAVMETESTGAAYNSMSMETGGTGDWADDVYEEVTEESEADTVSGLDQAASGGQKLIRNVSLTMETREFDTLLGSIQAKTEECGGYVQTSDISGTSYYSSGYRYAWLELRIPAERLDEFVTAVGNLGNVTNKNESVRDVTLEYVDIESHIEALETEQARLLELMEQAETMEDIIAIESRLSEIRYELQSYGSTLRTYDNQVNYSTVTVSVNEVERETVMEEDPGFFGEIRNRLSDNFYDIGQGFRDFAVWFISSLPYLALAFAVIWLAVRLVRKLIWKKPFFRRKKKEKEDLEG